MTLLYRYHEMYDEEVDFVEALRNTSACNFTMDEKQMEQLDDLRDDLFRIDDALSKLIQINPAMKRRYEQQHQETLDSIVGKIANLRLPCVRLAPKSRWTARLPVS